MSWGELVLFAGRAVAGHRLRTGLSLLGVAIGVSAVLVLTALGEGARRYVVNQFASLGTNLVIVIPGHTDTTGEMPGVGGTPHDFTLDDSRAIEREIPQVRRVAPVVASTVDVSHGQYSRQVALIGTTASYIQMRDITMERGNFLPPMELHRGAPMVVLGYTLAHDLFRGADPIGAIIRVGEWRMRVIGVLAKQGTNLGVNLDEIVMVPVATAMRMSNRGSLFRCIVEVRAHADLTEAKHKISALLTERHGELDTTTLTQDAVLATFSQILQVLTLAVAAIAAISLTVAGIGIMNVMLVAVAERTREIGLLMAVGVERRQILSTFLTEAGILATAGGVVGILVGEALVRLLVALYPAFPAYAPLWAIIASLAVSLSIGLLFGFLPARRATRLEPVLALRHK